MADRLTQLQDCFDQLATQMYASIHYVSTHHSASAIEGQPSLTNTSAAAEGNDPPGTEQDAQAQDPQQDQQQQLPRPDSPNTFAASLKELSRDLVIKEQQCEMIIKSLPGIDRSQVQQEARIKELLEQLENVDKEHQEAARVKDFLLERIDETIMKCRRV